MAVDHIKRLAKVRARLKSPRWFPDGLMSRHYDLWLKLQAYPAGGVVELNEDERRILGLR